ncbi:ankyrin [Nemania sp. FL0916]|nr:ankyrin [Nemania sp. FL0916]
MSKNSNLGCKERDFSLFEQHQLQLRELYLEQNRSLQEVKQAMESKHGFPEIEAKTYEYGLLHPGFVKKLSNEGWVIVDTHARKRKEREGKETNIYLSGIIQPRKKINRCISRHKKSKQVRDRIARGHTPDLPEYVSLRTPSPKPDVVAIRSNRIATQIPRPLPDVSKINEHSVILYPESFDNVRKEMLVNPYSSVHILPSIPSSQILEILLQGLIVEFPASRYQHHQQFHDDKHSPYSDTLVQKRNLLALCQLCVHAANGEHFGQQVDVGDLRELAATWIGADVNWPILKAFFALNIPGIAATWLWLVKSLNAGKAFRALVEIGLETHDGEWIHQHAATVIEAALQLEPRETKEIAERMSLRKPFRDGVRGLRIDDMLYHSAEYGYLEVISALIRAGAKSYGDPDNPVGAFTLKYRTVVQFLQRQDTREECIGLLETAGFDFDACVGPGFVFFDEDLGRMDVPRPWSLLDHLWISGEHDIYEAISSRSMIAKTEITISALISAAQIGTQQLQLYLESKPPGRAFIDSHRKCYRDQSFFLGAALSLAARLGDVAAIASFRQIGVDPNVRTFLSRPQRFKSDWHPLMSATGGKHLEAVRMLVHMGADLESDMVGFNPLAAAVGARTILSDTKRLKMIETVKYLLSILGKDLIHIYWVDAMLTAVTAPGDHSGIPCYCMYGCFYIPYENFVPDEEVVDLLLGLKEQSNGAMWENRDLLRAAIENDCNNKTIEFLLSRGVPLHLGACPDQVRAILQFITEHWPQYRAGLIRRLMLRNWDCTKEWDSNAILDIFAPHVIYEYNKWSRSMFLLLVEEAQLGPRLELAARGVSFLARLLSYEAPDELIDQAIKTGADIHAPGLHKCSEYTPLQLAILTGRPNIAHQLLNMGANVHAPASLLGHTALQAACDQPADSQITLSFIRYLLNIGAHINALGPMCKPPLYYAIFRGSMGVFCLLLDAGADVHALSYECKIFAYGGCMKNPQESETILDTAAIYGRLDMVSILLRRGAQSHKHGETPYDGAIKRADVKGYHSISKMIKAFARTGIC